MGSGNSNAGSAAPPRCDPPPPRHRPPPVIMSVVKPSMSSRQEQKLRSLFGHVQFHLLYKASVHGYEAAAFHTRCNQQGPTLLVAYNKAGYVYGAYTAMDYSGSEAAVSDKKAFLYSLGKDHETEALRVASLDGQHGFTDGKGTGPDFGALRFLVGDTARVVSAPGTGFYFESKKMHGDDLVLSELEVYRVEDLGGLLAKPWRTVAFTAETKQSLMAAIQNYEPDIRSVSKARVLLVGAVGAGKSSFFNSINSVFRGNMTSQAISGVCGKSVTTQFRCFSIKAGRGGRTLPLVLCDTMGLEREADAGLDLGDIYNIYKGHIADRHQFSPGRSLQEDAPGFRNTPTMEEQIHCVVYVVEASKLLSDEILEKMAATRKKTNQMNIPQLLLMTKVDEACPLVKENLANVYFSDYIYKKAQQLSTALGIPMGCVLPVKNYSHELQLEVKTDVLLLHSIQQMLYYADSFFDNQLPEDHEQEEDLLRSRVI